MEDPVFIFRPEGLSSVQKLLHFGARLDLAASGLQLVLNQRMDAVNPTLRNCSGPVTWKASSDSSAFGSMPFEGCSDGEAKATLPFSASLRTSCYLGQRRP